MKIVIDLLWVRPKQVGGTEVYIRNLLDGFQENDDKNEYYLLTTKDNNYSFERYLEDSRFIMLIAPITSANIVERVIWQSFCQNAFLKKNKLYFCFSPVLYRPLLNSGIKYISVIHDIQAKHFPQYHPIHEVLYSKLCWHLIFMFSRKIVTSSEFVKNDIVEHYNVNPQKINVIHIPVEVEKTKEELKNEVLNKYQVEEGKFYYTVSQLIPHKNLDVLLRVMKKIKNEKKQMPTKLLISGMKGNASLQLEKIIHEFGIEENVQLTGYISNDERNILYSCCHSFLFPSVFEGFGIPPIEAMIHNSIVVTTKKTCIAEITQNVANYVNDPFDEKEWITVMNNAQNKGNLFDYKRYLKKNIGKQYLQLFLEEYKNEKLKNN